MAPSSLAISNSVTQIQSYFKASARRCTQMQHREMSCVFRICKRSEIDWDTDLVFQNRMVWTPEGTCPYKAVIGPSGLFRYPSSVQNLGLAERIIGKHQANYE